MRLIEAAPSVLPALPERVQEATTRQLAALNVEIHTGQQVREVTAAGIHTRSGDFFPADLIVWTAGVKGPAWLAQLDGLEVDRLGRLVVDQTLQVSRDDNIFALGDCAACPQPGNRHTDGERYGAAARPGGASAGAYAGENRWRGGSTARRRCRSAIRTTAR